MRRANAIAAHESPRTIKLHDGTSDEITLDEIERILIGKKPHLAPLVRSRYRSQQSDAVG
jgi:hypothetical protein